MRPLTVPSVEEPERAQNVRVFEQILAASIHDSPERECWDADDVEDQGSN
jgi:hypothetical protein